MQDLLFVDNPDEIKAASGDEQAFCSTSTLRHSAVGACRVPGPIELLLCCLKTLCFGQ